MQWCSAVVQIKFQYISYSINFLFLKYISNHAFIVISLCHELINTKYDSVLKLFLYRGIPAFFLFFLQLQTSKILLISPKIFRLRWGGGESRPEISNLQKVGGGALFYKSSWCTLSFTVPERGCSAHEFRTENSDSVVYAIPQCTAMTKSGIVGMTGSQIVAYGAMAKALFRK